MTQPLVKRAFAPRNVAWLWAGVLIGLYLIEFPARFTSAQLDYADAIGLGAAIFERLALAEWLLLALLVASAVVCRAPRGVWLAVVAVAAIIAVESLVLLPELTARAASIVAAGAPGPSSAHRIYSSLELVKAAALIVVALRSD